MEVGVGEKYTSLMGEKKQVNVNEKTSIKSLLHLEAQCPLHPAQQKACSQYQSIGALCVLGRMQNLGECKQTISTS